jgi:hypothetical protein
LLLRQFFGTRIPDLSAEEAQPDKLLQMPAQTAS